MHDLIPVPPRYLVYALRWALDDRSGRSRDVAAALIEHRAALSRADQVFVIREVNRALETCTAGRPRDDDLWRDVVVAMGGRPRVREQCMT